MPIKKRDGTTHFCIIKNYYVDSKGYKITTFIGTGMLRVREGLALIEGRWVPAEKVNPEHRGGAEYEIWLEGDR
jgi:hypothetical protein